VSPYIELEVGLKKADAVLLENNLFNLLVSAKETAAAAPA